MGPGGSTSHHAHAFEGPSYRELYSRIGGRGGGGYARFATVLFESGLGPPIEPQVVPWVVEECSGACTPRLAAIVVVDEMITPTRGPGVRAPGSSLGAAPDTGSASTCLFKERHTREHGW